MAARCRRPKVMSREAPALVGWTNRDVQRWKEELESGAKGGSQQTLRQKFITLIAAATSFIAGGGWGKFVTKVGCPPIKNHGTLCTNMKLYEMIYFPAYALGFTVAVILVAYCMDTIRTKLDTTIATKVKDSSLLQRAESAERKKEELEKVAKQANDKTFTMMSGGWTYNCVVLWTIALHAPLPYTTLFGVWMYFFCMLFFCAAMLTLAFEAIPAVTAWLRRKCPNVATKKWEQPRLVLVANAIGGAAAWVLGIGLMDALEVTAAEMRGLPDGAELTYYWGGLHNVPLLVRYLLCVVVVCLVLPLHMLLKHSQRHPIRDVRPRHLQSSPFCDLHPPH